jgi:RNA polymerase sigma factor (sigma-70 family)
VSETDLIGRARQGDALAWETIVRQQQQAVFRLAYLRLGDVDEAEDVTQETFIRAVQALDRFQLDRPLRPWLLRIAANLAANRRRGLGRYWAALRRSLEVLPEATDSPGENLQQEQDTQALWRALRRLRPLDQEVIYLRYFLELSVTETAEAAGVAPGTVKSRLNRALSRLRTVIEREYPALQEGRQV